MAALAARAEARPGLPFIIVTGPSNEETAVECIKAGAWDYVIKEHLRRLGPAFSSRHGAEKAPEERRGSPRKSSAEREELYRKIFEDLCGGQS